MIYCEKCKINISGNRTHCPLCGKKISNEEIKEDYDIFPVIPFQKDNQLFLRIVTFIAVVLIIVTAIIDTVFIQDIELGTIMCFGVACAYILLLVGYKKWKNLRKAVMYEAAAGIILSVLWDWYLGWHGWSISYVLPLAVVGLNTLYFAMGLIDHSHETDYGIYFLITIAGTALVFVLLLSGVLLSEKLASITVGIGGILLAAKIIFAGQSFKEELSRRMHL